MTIYAILKTLLFQMLKVLGFLVNCCLIALQYNYLITFTFLPNPINKMAEIKAVILPKKKGILGKLFKQE